MNYHRTFLVIIGHSKKMNEYHNKGGDIGLVKILLPKQWK